MQEFRKAFLLGVLCCFAPLVCAETVDDATCGAEVKIQLSSASLSAASKAFSGKPTERTIVLFDTSDANLFDQGVILRYREGKKKADLTAKIRPDNGRHVPKPAGSSGEFKCETDVSIDGSRPAYSLKTQVKKSAPRDGKELKHRLDNSQISFLGSAGTDIRWKEIIARPPVASTEWEADADGMPLSLEHWTWAGHSVLELSTKVSSIAEVAGTMAKLQHWAKERDLQIVTGASKVSAVLHSE